MQEKICPRCGRIERDDKARYCDVDGAPLAPRVAPGTEPRHDEARGLGWGVLVIVLVGLVAGGLFWGETFISESGRQETEWPAGDGRRDGPGAQISPRDAGNPKALLRLCFGDPPPALPNAAKGRNGELFSAGKGALQVGTGIAATLVGRDLSPQERADLDAIVEEELISRYGSSRDRAARRRVARIMQKFEPLVAPGAPPYQFLVLGADEMNAFMGPNRRVYLLAGLVAALDDHQLAAVIGHELAHSKLDHGEDLLRLAAKGGDLGARAGERGGQAGFTLSALALRLLQAVYSHDMEYDADRLGLCMAALAGYDPVRAATAIDVIARQARAVPESSKGRIAYDIVTTHPPATERSAYLAELAERLVERF